MSLKAFSSFYLRKYCKFTWHVSATFAPYWYVFGKSYSTATQFVVEGRSLHLSYGGTCMLILKYRKNHECVTNTLLIYLVFSRAHFFAGRYSVSPLVAVGYEGLFGTISILMFIPILAIPSVSAMSPFFDFPRGWHQTIDTPSVLYSGLAICVSISLFNFFGLSVTRHVSATARSLTDTCRTLSIWIISLGLGWEKLVFPISLLQVLGFSFLV